MRCTIHRSRLHEFTYVYLQDGFEFEDLPMKLQDVFGKPEEVMQLELQPGLRLAQEDTEQVMANLADRGWHLQLPPDDDPSGWLDLTKKD